MLVEAVDTEGAFGALVASWNALADRADAASVFLSHEWFRAAWSWRRQDARLFILVVRDGSRVVGILPLLRERAGRALALLTVPDTQLCDLVAEPTQLSGTVAALADELGRRRDWDILELGYLSPEGNIVRALAPALAHRGMHLTLEDGGRNPYIRLTDGWHDYYEARSRSLKKANNLALNRFEKAGAVRWEH